MDLGVPSVHSKIVDQAAVYFGSGHFVADAEYGGWMNGNRDRAPILELMDIAPHLGNGNGTAK